MSDDEAPRPWRWRNLRTLRVTITVAPFPWNWQWGVWSVCDGGEHIGGAYGKHWAAMVGPFAFCLQADIGNCSTGDWRARFGLSEEEAWERSK